MKKKDEPIQEKTNHVNVVYKKNDNRSAQPANSFNHPPLQINNISEIKEPKNPN